MKAIDDKSLILIVTTDLSSAELIKEIIPDIRDNVVYKSIPLYDLRRTIESKPFLS